MWQNMITYYLLVDRIRLQTFWMTLVSFIVSVARVPLDYTNMNVYYTLLHNVKYNTSSYTLLIIWCERNFNTLYNDWIFKRQYIWFKTWQRWAGGNISLPRLEIVKSYGTSTQEMGRENFMSKALEKFHEMFEIFNKRLFLSFTKNSTSLNIMWVLIV